MKNLLDAPSTIRAQEIHRATKLTKIWDSGSWLSCAKLEKAQQQSPREDRPAGGSTLNGKPSTIPHTHNQCFFMNNHCS